MTNNFKPSITILSIDNNKKYIKSSISSCKKIDCFDKIILCHNGNENYKEYGVNEITGFDHVTSALNKSMALISSDFNIFIMSGTQIRLSQVNKILTFYKSNNEIICPTTIIFDKEKKKIKYMKSFHDCSLNGLSISKRIFNSVGELDEKEDLEKSRILWYYRAIEKNAIFKSILGLRL